MKSKIAVSLDEELIAFLDEQAPNRSEYLNSLLVEQRSKVLKAQMIAALRADEEDVEYQAEIAAWAVVVGEGLDAER